MDAYRQMDDAGNQGTVLVWVEDVATPLPLLRMARRKARDLGVSWEIVHIEVAHQEGRYEPGQTLATLALAEQMGAKTTHIFAHSARSGLIRLLIERQASGHPVQLLVLPHRRDTFFSRSHATAIARKAPTGLRIITVDNAADVVPITPHWVTMFKFNLFEGITCVMAVAVATAVLQILALFSHTVNIGSESIIVFYLLACAFSAGRFGLFAGIFTATVSALTYALLYIAPNGPLSLDRPSDVYQLGLYFIAALALSFFTSQSFAQRERYATRAQRTHALFQLHRVTMDYRTRTEAVTALHKEITVILGSPVAFYLPAALNPTLLELAYPEAVDLSDAERDALQRCWLESKATGLGSTYASNLGWRFLPLLTSQGEIGVMAVKIADPDRFDIPSGRLFGALADQVALIIERFELGQIMEESRLRDEREKLRSMLLSSVSHDLKTPLASVIGALSVYQTMGAKLSDEHRATLISTALEEAQRLDSFITNILDMTRLESGTIDFKKEWVAPEDIIRRAERRMRHRLANHHLGALPNETGREILIDTSSAEQMLQNLLDNAVKYTPQGTQITIQAYSEGSQFIIAVRDHGEGIPADKLDKIFDKYARLRRTDSQVAGTGLGLAICRSMMQSQGGSIEARNHPEGGAVFTLIFPQWRRAQTTDNMENAA